MSLLGDLPSSLSQTCQTVISQEKTATIFKTQIQELIYILRDVEHIDNIWVQNLEPSIRSEVSTNFTHTLLIAHKLVRKCPDIKWNLFKKASHLRKLNKVNDKLFKSCLHAVIQARVEAEARARAWTRFEAARVEGESSTIGSENAPLSSSNSAGRFDRFKWGWKVPMLSKDILTFEPQLNKLKKRVLANNNDDCSVVVVSAGGGCGKTTLVNILCHDPEMLEKFVDNIFYVTVSETLNFMELVNGLFYPYFSSQDKLQSNEEAKKKLEIFFRDEISGPILLVLDDVHSDSFIRNFEFKISGYTLLVTSNKIFLKYDLFDLEPLSNEDAKRLFELSAFKKHVMMSGLTIDENHVNQMIKYCRKHPLTLSVIGSSLNGKHEFVWKSLLKILSQEQWVLDQNDHILKRLERIIEDLDEDFKKCLLEFEALDEESKQCLLDLGLFPKDHRVSACALLDIWMNMYDHDDMGRDTFTKITELLYRNLVSSITIGKEANAVVNYCEQISVTPQDLQRELAIHCSSKEPISQRTRLIIDAQGKDLPASIKREHKSMSACMLSISTGALFSSRWYNMKVPEVEVMVLNINSETYTLPHFLKKTPKLKILNVTNYGLQPTTFRNFHLLIYSTNLTRIRFESVVIPPLSTSIFSLVKLEKLSFIMCKIGSAFDQLSTEMVNVWPRLVEVEMDNCQDLVGFPEVYCNSVHLEKLSITNCTEMSKIPEEFGKLQNLEKLGLHSCIKLEKLPESITRLQKLKILDISDCLRLTELPEQIGNLGGLRMIYMKGCTSINELPPSVMELSQTQVVCSEELSYKWQEFPNVTIPVVEEDRLLTLTENIISVEHFC